MYVGLLLQAAPQLSSMTWHNDHITLGSPILVGIGRRIAVTPCDKGLIMSRGSRIENNEKRRRGENNSIQSCFPVHGCFFYIDLLWDITFLDYGS